MEQIMEMGEELVAPRDQWRVRDEVLASSVSRLTELWKEQQRQVVALQNEVSELTAQIRLSQLGGPEVSRKIAYRDTIRRISEAVRRLVPGDSSVLMVSRGDDELLHIEGWRVAHFPQDQHGIYSGYYPKCGQSAIAHLETLRSQGANYLVFPEPALWWLDTYPEFRRHLDRRYLRLLNDSETGVIYALQAPSAQVVLSDAIAECRQRLRREPTILNWNCGVDLQDAYPETTVFSPIDPAASTLPYLDSSIDLVAVAHESEIAIAEARRVAAQAILQLSSNHDCRVEWLNQNASELSTVSIVIPVYNHAETTAACLRSLVETLPSNFRGEIVVVDDDSTDDTRVLLKSWMEKDERIHCLRNAENQGFLEAVRRGAAAATGEILLFLNNDVILLPNWLPPLLRVFDDFADAGAVGGKLLFADGSLQEAGGLVFRDGSAGNYGRGDQDLEAPEYNFVREIDYCSGALLATRRELFERIGGFDVRFRPAYYEDTDYCFAVRQAGYRVYYQPESAVVHLDGVSSGNDLTRGIKQYQVLNQAKFVDKWSEALVRQPERPHGSGRSSRLSLALAVNPRHGELP